MQNAALGHKHAYPQSFLNTEGIYRSVAHGLKLDRNVMSSVQQSNIFWHILAFGQSGGAIDYLTPARSRESRSDG